MGSGYQHNYVHFEIYELVKDFMSLPPSKIRKRFNIIEFEVSHAHISRKGDPNHFYSIQTDEHMSILSAEDVCYKYNPLHLHLQTPPKSDRFDRLSIYREDVNKTFLLKKDSMFTHCQVIEEDIIFELEGWGYLWETRLQKKWICPYNSSLDPDSIVFRCKPVYSVQIITEGCPTLDMIKKFIKYALPKYFDGSYVPLVST